MSYGVFSEFYDALTANVSYDTVSQVLSSLLTRYGKSRGLLLDLACGTGSVSVRLAKKGYEVIGVDLSPEMLSEAQNKAYSAGQNILFLCQDMTALDLYGTVDAAVCTLDGLCHLPNEESVFAALRKVSLFMNPGGVFLFDVNSDYKHRAVLGNNTFVYDTDDVYCVWQNTWIFSSRSQARATMCAKANALPSAPIRGKRSKRCSKRQALPCSTFSTGIRKSLRMTRANGCFLQSERIKSSCKILSE